MQHRAVEIHWNRSPARRRRPRWVPALFYLGLLFANIVLMLFFSAGARSGVFLDLYARIVPAHEEEPATEEEIDPRHAQFPPPENWTGEERTRIPVMPIARPGPPLQ